MPTDDLSSPRSGDPFAARGGRIPDRAADELDEAAERLEDSSWERFETSPGRGESAMSPEDHPGAIASFLEQQLRDRPLPTLLAAVAAGWLVGKLLR